MSTGSTSIPHGSANPLQRERGASTAEPVARRARHRRTRPTPRIPVQGQGVYTDENLVEIDETKEYHSSIIAPGYMPHQLFSYMTGDDEVIKFHILPTSIFEGNLLEYRHKCEERNQVYVSNNNPGQSDLHLREGGHRLPGHTPQVRLPQPGNRHRAGLQDHAGRRQLQLAAHQGRTKAPLWERPRQNTRGGASH